MSYLIPVINSIFTLNNFKTLAMTNQMLPLYSWGNGVVMILVFALICTILVAVLINFMMSGNKKKDQEQEK